MISKKYKINISSDNYVMRDHTVQDISVMPGVTLIDIILRAFQNLDIKKEEIVLNRILFSHPIWTTSKFNRRLLINIDQINENDFSVEVSSCTVKGNISTEIYETNATLRVSKIESYPLKSSTPLNIKELESTDLIAKCNLDEAYKITRNMRIIHGPFMKAVGNIFSYKNEIIVEIELSELAQSSNPNNFLFHPSLLDSSTLPYSSVFNIYLNRGLHKNTYIPMYVEKFYCMGNAGNKIYIKTSKINYNQNIDQDLIYNSYKIYDINGNYIAEFENLGAKKIRDSEYLKKQVEKINNVPITISKAVQNSIETENGKLENIESTDYEELLKLIITEIYPNILIQDTKIGFYDLGLDSSGLLKIVKKLEDRLNIELYPTLLFEYKSIKELALYLQKESPIPLNKKQEQILSYNFLKSTITNNIKKDKEVDASNIIIEYLIKIVQSLNTVLKKEIDIYLSFYDHGLDSSNLLEIVKKIEELLKIELYPTLLFEYKNIKELGDYLYKNYFNKIQLLVQEKGQINADFTEQLKNETKDWNDVNFYQPYWQDITLNNINSDKNTIYSFTQKHVSEEKDNHYLIINPTININDINEIFNSIKKDKKVFIYIDYISANQYTENCIFLVNHILKEIYKHRIEDFIFIINNYDNSNIFIKSLTGYFKTACIEFPKSAFLFIENYLIPNIDTFENFNSVCKRIKDIKKGFSYYKITSDKSYISLYAKTPYKFPQGLRNFRKGGKYLITGGGGSVAQTIAKYLLKEYQAVLCLVSRSKKSQKINDLINIAKESGGKLIYIKADLSDKKQVFDSIRKMRNTYKEINGVFHCAGLVQDSKIIDKNDEQIKLILSPKIVATNNLDEALKNEKLDFFMMTSSLSSITGNVGQADYAYANSYLNEFSIKRDKQVKKEKRFGKSISIAWPFWKDGGMKIDNELVKQMEKFFGLKPISNFEGLNIIEFSLHDEITNLVIPIAGHPKRINYLIDKTVVDNTNTNNDKKENTTNYKINKSSDTNIDNKDIAIIGISGKFPKSKNLDEFWKNISQGKSCIEEIPVDRWNTQKFYSQDRTEEGKYYCNKGGFISEYDMFDPLFFNISPEEAERMDPNERLFLLETWRAFEDAGYSQKRISEVFDNQVGVFAGVMWGDYEALGIENLIKGNSNVVISSFSTIVNRVSYFLNLKGPSMPIDTMCSSSMMALHIACQSIINRECKAAVVGGVNLSIHPWKYIKLSQMQMLSPQGACKAFGDGADGYVPGEGIISFILKPYSEAIKDKDSIYAIIKGTGVTHSGHTAGLTVPSPIAQAQTIKQAIKNANIPEELISYIEAHGTGTSLGDPIEIAGLRLAFKDTILKKRYIGSVKSNIGHLEGCAALASIAKVCMQFNYNKITPSLYTEKLNSKLDLKNTNFTIANKLTHWEEDENDSPLTATVSSFGAGGTNVCVVLQKNYFKHKYEVSTDSHFIITLSAKNKKTLYNYINVLYTFFKNKQENEYSLQAIENTFKYGRNFFKERKVILYNSFQDLIDQLTLYKNQQEEDIKSKLQNIKIKEKDKIINWLDGKDIIWDAHVLEKYGMAPLPFYPFDLKRYWIDLKGSLFFDNTLTLISNKKTIVNKVDEKENINIKNNHDFIENILFKVLHKILKIEKSDISIEDPIFNLGIDSVIAMKIVSELKNENVQVPLSLLIQNPTMKELINSMIYQDTIITD